MEQTYKDEKAEARDFVKIYYEKFKSSHEKDDKNFYLYCIQLLEKEYRLDSFFNSTIQINNKK